MWFDGDRTLCDFKENVLECGGALPTTPAPIASDFAEPMSGTSSLHLFLLDFSELLLVIVD
jgi:hypothetical protein